MGWVAKQACQPTCRWGEADACLLLCRTTHCLAVRINHRAFHRCPLVSHRIHLLHSLSENEIGDEGAEAIGEGLAGSSVTTLKSVAWSGVY